MAKAGTRIRLAVHVAAALGFAALALPSLASARDRNHDRIPDRWERHHSLSLRVNQARRDQDHDWLVNRKEFLARMDPHDADSDNDGTGDAEEGAGTIVSFDPSTGELTINDFVGGSVTALVTDSTEISCDSGDAAGDEDNDGVGGDDDNVSGDDGKVAAASDDDQGDDAQENDDERACSAADLVPGAVVQEADVELTSQGLVFEEIELRA